MKTIFISTLVLLSLAACNSNAQKQTAEKKAEASQQQQAIPAPSVYTLNTDDLPPVEISGTLIASTAYKNNQKTLVSARYFIQQAAGNITITVADVIRGEKTLLTKTVTTLPIANINKEKLQVETIKATDDGYGPFYKLTITAAQADKGFTQTMQTGLETKNINSTTSNTTNAELLFEVEADAKKYADAIKNI